MRQLLVISLIVGPLAVLSWRLLRSRRLILLYCLAFYSAYFSTLSGQRLGLSIAVPLVMLAVLAEVVNAVQNHRSLGRWRPADAIVAAFLVWALIVAFARPEQPLTFIHVASIALILAAAKLRPSITDDDLFAIRTTLVIAGLVVAVCCFVQTYASPTLFDLIQLRRDYAAGEAGRVPGTFANPNLAAFYLTFSFAAAITQWASDRSRGMARSRLWPVALALLFAGIYLTGSRAAILAVVAVGWIEGARVINRRRMAALVALGLMLVPLVLINPIATEVQSHLFPARPAVTSTGRTERWRLAADTLERSALFGDATVEFRGRRANYHNDILHYTVALGLPGGGLFILLLTTIGFTAWRQAEAGLPGDYGSFALATFIGVLVISASHTVIQDGFVFWLIVGFLVQNKSRKPTSLPIRAPVIAA